MANRHVVPEAIALLKYARSFWEDELEDLRHGFIKLTIKLWKIDCEKPKIRAPIMEQNGVIFCVSDILAQVFERNSSVTDLVFNFQGDSSKEDLPLIIQWLGALLLGHNIGQKMLKAIRPIVPILSKIVKDGHTNVKSSLIHRDTRYLETILKVFNIVLKSSRNEYERDLKLVLESQMIINFNLMEVFDRYPSKSIFPAPKKNDKGHVLETSTFFITLDMFMKLLSKNFLLRSNEERQNILKNILSILKRNKIYDINTRVYHNKRAEMGNLPFKPSQIIEWIRKIFEPDLESKNFVKKYCNSEINIISSMLTAALCHKIDSKSETVDEVFRSLNRILKNCNDPELIDHVVPFLPLGFEEFDSCYCQEDRLQEGEITWSCKGKPGIGHAIRLLSPIPRTTFRIFHSIIQHATILNIKKLDAEYNFIPFIFKIIDFSNYYFSKGLQIIVMMIDKHQFEVVSSKVLVKKVTSIWKRTKLEFIDKFDPFSKTNAFELIMKLKFLLISDVDNPVSLTDKNVSDFENVIVEFVPQHWASQSKCPKTLTVIWSMIRREQCKVLTKVLYAELPGLSETIGYFAYGNNEVAKIFKYLSDIFIKCLEQDPPHDAKYLISLTDCMVLLAKTHKLDEELYVLEDMVSPAMWLLEKNSDDKIVANVKEFVRILH